MPGNDHGIPWEAEMDFEPAKRPRLEKTDAMASFETSNFAGCFFLMWGRDGNRMSYMICNSS